MDQAEEAISRVDPVRREVIRRLVAIGFVVPAVATFSMSGLMVRPAFALPNQS